MPFITLEFINFHIDTPIWIKNRACDVQNQLYEHNQDMTLLHISKYTPLLLRILYFILTIIQF